MWARPPSPPPVALPLRKPSPLGRYDDGVQIGVPAASLGRPSSCPPQSGPLPVRVPSPGAAARVLNPPVDIARRTSKMELQKIQCRVLQTLLTFVASEVSRVVRAVMKIETRISRMWTVPQRAARTAIKNIALGFTSNARYLVLYLTAVSHASRKMLNFIATCIKETHGLKDFSQLQDIQSVVDELLLLRKHWERMCKLEEAYGDVLTTHTADLEKGMDPDVWQPGSPISREITELADAHRSVKGCYARTFSFFNDLTIQEWNPPFLSPADVKAAASSWKEVELSALNAVQAVRTNTRFLLETAIAGQFMKKEDGVNALESLNVGVPTYWQDSDNNNGPLAQPGLFRSQTTVGTRPNPNANSVGGKLIKSGTK